MCRVLLAMLLMAEMVLLPERLLAMDIAEFFNKATYENMDQVCSDFYDPEIVFQDPLVKITSRSDLINYYKNLYKNLEEIKFIPLSKTNQDDMHVLEWRMDLRHKSLKSGELVSLNGVSVVRFKEGKAIYHRDYFDVSEMLHDNIPVVGAISRFIKSKAGQH
jgi:limonene-1,2-epoxide hydrolase